MKVGILGGGLAALELGKRLKQLGYDFIILEKHAEVGGLCRTLNSGEFKWDFGVHAIYSKNQQVMDYLRGLPIEYEHHNRTVRICHWKGDQIYSLNYPFENGLGDLPLEDKVDCLMGYIQSYRQGKRKFHSLKEWIEQGLGYGIARHFMIPYNRKIWNCELSKISLDLVKNKIEPAPLEEIIKSVLGIETIGRAYQAKFIYPKKGIGELTRVLSMPIQENIRLDSKVTRLVNGRKGWKVFCNHTDHHYQVDLIVSTMPLVELLKLVDLSGLEKSYKALRYNSTYFFLVGLKDGCRFHNFSNCHWVFFAGEEVFYRITFMNNFSSAFPPSLVVEITFKGKAARMPAKQLLSLLINDLKRCRIIRSEDDVAVVDNVLYHYTYPIPTVDSERVKRTIKRELKKRKIYLFGRSGAWEYINMDGVVEKVGKFLEENGFQG